MYTQIHTYKHTQVHTDIHTDTHTPEAQASPYIPKALTQLPRVAAIKAVRLCWLTRLLLLLLLLVLVLLPLARRRPPIIIPIYILILVDILTLCHLTTKPTTTKPTTTTITIATAAHTISAAGMRGRRCCTLCAACRGRR
jgi:hypothetical protein